MRRTALVPLGGWLHCPVCQRRLMVEDHAVKTGGVAGKMSAVTRAF